MRAVSFHVQLRAAWFSYHEEFAAAYAALLMP